MIYRNLVVNSFFGVLNLKKSKSTFPSSISSYIFSNSHDNYLYFLDILIISSFEIDSIMQSVFVRNINSYWWSSDKNEYVQKHDPYYLRIINYEHTWFRWSKYKFYVFFSSLQSDTYLTTNTSTIPDLKKYTRYTVNHTIFLHQQLIRAL